MASWVNEMDEVQAHTWSVRMASQDCIFVTSYISSIAEHRQHRCAAASVYRLARSALDST